MTFEEASSVATNASVVLSAILNDWITGGQVIYILPVAALGDGEEDNSPSVELHVLPDLSAEAKMAVLKAVQPIVESGVSVTMIWSAVSLDGEIHGTVH
jgi:hypothetical protein